MGDVNKGGRLRFFTQDVVKIPITTNRDERLVSFVNQIMESYELLQNATSDSKKDFIQKQIMIIDRKIDLLVYQLYGLTDEEIKIVEGE